MCVQTQGGQGGPAQLHHDVPGTRFPGNRAGGEGDADGPGCSGLRDLALTTMMALPVRAGARTAALWLHHAGKAWLIMAAAGAARTQKKVPEQFRRTGAATPVRVDEAVMRLDDPTFSSGRAVRWFFGGGTAVPSVIAGLPSIGWKAGAPARAGR